MPTNRTEARCIVTPEGKGWVARIEGLDGPKGDGKHCGAAVRALQEAIKAMRAEGKEIVVQKGERRALVEGEQEMVQFV